MPNRLHYGDNLRVLRESIADEAVDLIYLDPPFNSAATYNVLFKAPDGKDSASQVEAFEDTWHWGAAAEEAFYDVLRGPHTSAATLLKAMRAALGENDMMAYLTMMAARLIELHRVLKPTGSLYLHCDPTASHYLKILMDAIFGRDLFVNEIVWKRSDAKGDYRQGAKHFGRVHDTILFYSASNDRVWNQQFTPLEADYVEGFYRYKDPDGRRYKLDNMLGPGGAEKGNPFYEVMGVSRHWRYSRERMEKLIEEGRVVQTRPGTVPMYKRYLDESKGVPVGDLWTDISLIRGWSSEKLGYPTQKPLALLERIIAASSNPGDTVLDPFCGCGTAVHAAQRLGRQWIGIDVTHLAISLIERRLKDAFGTAVEFTVEGTPRDLAAARDLAERSKYQFQWWAVSLVDAQPWGGKKKGADGGVDGIRWMRTGPNPGDVASCVVSVKGGDNVTVSMIRDLRTAMENAGAEAALFLTLAEPTKPMREEAAKAGLFASPFAQKPYQRVQIWTIRELLAGMRPDLPPLGKDEGFKRAPKEKPKGQQRDLGF